MTVSSRSYAKPRQSAVLQYTLLALIALLAAVHVAVGTLSAFNNLAHGTEISIPPVYNGSQSRILHLSPAECELAGVPRGFVLLTTTYISRPARLAGLKAGDALYTVDGRPFLGISVLTEELSRRRPGQTVDLTFWRNGTPLDTPPAHATVVLTPQRIVPPTVWEWSLQALFTILPTFCLLTGLYVVFARPRSTDAWLILGILGYLSAFFLRSSGASTPLLSASLLWVTLGQTAMPPCFMLFGIYFPYRAPRDIRFPWIKWVVLLPILALLPVDLLGDVGTHFRFSLIAPLYDHLTSISTAENVISTLGIFFGFFCLGEKRAAPTTSPDARRRLQVLITGCSLGLTPLLFLLAYSIYHGRGGNIGEDIPRWFAVTVFLLLLSFPLTLAYVVIVQRAVDVRILLRQGTKYFFARQSILVLGILLSGWMSYEISLAILNHGHRGVLDATRLFAIVGVFFVYRRIGAKRMQLWIDQKFFREAYSTEQLLSELSDEARNFTETSPLLHTIVDRLASTLHIDRIAVFLRTGEVFQLEFATGLPLSPGYIPALSATSITIAHLNRGNSAPANVYRDDPSSWLVDATDTERAALADLSTELLVPLPGRNRLVGVIALGPKASEEPYSKTDRQLLQSVASQTGLALENAELLENLTVELNQRARLTREAEIAREVQERLFPQTYPDIPGIDLAGFCRPAYFVGGDYYDFFLIPQSGEGPASRLAIAIGDISGKGVSAALLMASLRASLRSVATLQQPGTASTNHLATLMQHVNRLVYEASTSNRYATFFYAELDPETRVLQYVNAGHNCPVILRSGKSIQLEPTGTVIGLLPDAAYVQATIQLQSGDTLLAFTDGISEAMTAEDEEWGEDSMVDATHRLLDSPTPHTARQLLDALLAEADAFTAGAPQHDDMTLLLATVA